MANHYHKGDFVRKPANTASEILGEIEQFVHRCAQPAILEEGDDPLPLVPGQHAWEVRQGAVYLSAWPSDRSINRRVVAIEARKPGLLVCTIQRFGRASGRLNLLDLAHPRSANRLLSGGRRSFSEIFRRMLNRQFPEWNVRVLTTEMSLQQSFSPKFPRAVLEKGSQRIAAVACPAAADEHQLLSFALIWHNYVSGGAQNHARVPLALFLPEGAGNVTALRLRWLRLTARLFRFNQHGSAGEIDASDLGNMDTRIVPRKSAILSEALQTFLDHLAAEYGIEAKEESEVSVKLRCNGLEFAEIREDQAFCGLPGNSMSRASLPEIENLAARLAEIRHAPSQQRDHPLYRSEPENWMEASIKREVGAIDPTLEGQPVWSQVITFAAADRDVVDLLGCSRGGRIAVLELKTTEDIHLPLQALDYWMRIEWHTRAGDLDPFFRNVAVLRQAPKMLLIAPAVQFHPSNEIILSYFDVQIETERVGLNLEWQQGLKVAFRLQGWEKPQSQRRSQ